MRSSTLLIIALVYFAAIVNARCECGYALTAETSSDSVIAFTDLVESDFLHIRDIAVNTDWQRQNFTKTPEAGRGPYGYVLAICHHPLFQWSGTDFRYRIV